MTRIYLIGFMGSGKSTAGKKLAKKLGFNFIDLDNLIEKETQMSISEYFSMFGEEKFRILEEKVLYQSFSFEHSVISTGGGTPCFFDNIEKINLNGISVYLQADIPLIMSRIQNEKNQRPLIKDKSNDELRKYLENLLEKREKFYKKAKITVNAKNLDIPKLVNTIKQIF